MEKERIVRSGILDKPVHGTENVLLCRLAHWVLLIIRQDHHVFPAIAEMLRQVGRHVPNIVDTSAQLAALPKVVDANQEGLSASCAI